MPKMTTFEDVINLWPSLIDMAEDLQVEYETVRQWKRRNRIPQEYFFLLRRVAHERGLKLNADDILRIAQ